MGVWLLVEIRVFDVIDSVLGNPERMREQNAVAVRPAERWTALDRKAARTAQVGRWKTRPLLTGILGRCSESRKCETTRIVVRIEQVCDALRGIDWRKRRLDTDDVQLVESVQEIVRLQRNAHRHAALYCLGEV